jgi:L-asparaginase
MAYTTAALSILVAPTIPVVITGSQYPFGYPGGDARDNFMHGLTASIIEKPGVYAVFGGELFPGNQLHKVSTVSPKAFTTINPKHTITPFPMGNRMPLDAILRDSSVKVELIVPGYEPRWLEALLMDKSVKGIVLVAYGAGGLPTEGERSLIPLLGQYSDKKPIVIVSQTIHGGVDLNKYEVGQQLLSAGVIPAGIESLEHASFKLKYLIAQSFSIAQIRDAFGRVSHE